MAVHPHVCGEGHINLHLRIVLWGSSPRVWGRRFKKEKKIGKDRFIPTCVGKAEQTANTASLSTVHPHVCGEGLSLRPKWQIRNGSSPRVWGRLNTQSHAGNRPRFIPTCVGKASVTRLKSATLSVHPHVCGEGGSQAGKQQALCSSSPRVWGRRAWSLPICRTPRFIPTCVGKATILECPYGAPA